MDNNNEFTGDLVTIFGQEQADAVDDHANLFSLMSVDAGALHQIHHFVAGKDTALELVHANATPFQVQSVDLLLKRLEHHH